MMSLFFFVYYKVVLLKWWFLFWMVIWGWLEVYNKFWKMELLEDICGFGVRNILLCKWRREYFFFGLEDIWWWVIVVYVIVLKMC